MTKKSDVEIITEAKPHTIKKFELIERYVDEWARKILGFEGVNGHDGSKGVIYIDCMSNSGVYKDIEGKLVDGTALRVAKKLNDIIPNYPGKHAILIFNDLVPEKIQFLKEEIDRSNLANIEVYFKNEDCNALLRGLNLEGFKKQYNTLLLYDPYNAFIDWDAVTPYLNRWGEVIINHMVSDTSRGASQAKNPAVIARYTETYQNDIQTIIEMGKNKKELNDVVISIINDRFMRPSSQKYIASFPFFTRSNGLLYNLIHCCSNIEGIKLFKKVAWKTFGDKSSLKNTHGNELQTHIDLFGTGIAESETDEDCYFVEDIAKYIYKKFGSKGSVSLSEIYEDLDKHPIFPSDGYKLDIKDALRQIYCVEFHRDGTVTFPAL